MEQSLGNGAAAPEYLTPQQVRLALHLGWSISEVYGRIHKGVYLRKRDEQSLSEIPPRFSFSDRQFTVGQRLWLASHRINALAETLMKELGVEEGASAAEEMLSQPIRDLPDRIRRHIDDPHGVPLPTERELYQIFEDWSVDLSVRLSVHSGLLSLAFTFGGGLADTYWYMRPPRRFGRGKSPESWHELLVRQRLTEMIRRARRLEPYLPPEVGLLLRHSLWEWGIAQEMERHEGKLRIAHPWLYRWRAIHRVRERRAKKMARRWEGKVGEERFVTLERNEERDIYRNLRRQARIWSDLIHGSREPQDYLLPSDWRQVRGIAGVMSGAVIVLLAVTGWYGVQFLFRVINYLLTTFSPRIAFPTELTDLLAITTTLATVALFLATQTVRIARRLIGLYRSLHQWLVKRKMEQRTLVGWDGKVKPLFFTCLESLIFAWRRE